MRERERERERERRSYNHINVNVHVLLYIQKIEVKNFWYSTTSSFLATSIADLLNLTIFIGFQSICLYLVTDAPRDDGHVWRMFTVAAIGIIFSLLLFGQGQLIGLWLRDYPRASSFLAPVVSAPWSVLAGHYIKV